MTISTGGQRVAGSVAAGVIDELVEQGRVLARAQARHAALMVHFADTRGALDQRDINEVRHRGGRPQFKAGEFACTEMSLAVMASKFMVRRTVAMARRVRAEAPEAWDAWVAGDIDLDKVVRINRALRRLVRESSKQLLNSVVVDLAVCRTPEILGRCLNQFIARVEPDLQDERLHRSLEDRYVSVRPDLDGVSFLSAAVSSVDAHAIDQVLGAIAAAADPGDGRTVQQRRADALVDVLLGRMSNGCHVVWDTNTDTDDHLDDDPQDNDTDGTNNDPPGDDPHGAVAEPAAGAVCGAAGAGLTGAGLAGAGPVAQDAVVDEWELPASAFRPDHRAACVDDPVDDGTARPGTVGRARVTRCTGGGQLRPLPVTVGVVVSVQSLLGVTNTPGQLMDRTASVPADVIRDLAGQPGTLFYRLLTDPQGNLLDVTEMGRFPSRRLGAAVKFRDGVCANPGCTVPAVRCDLDHLIPVPAGPTTAGNLSAECRHEHRAKTHGGHRCERTGPHTTQWTTPTGHVYTSNDEPLPVENWPSRA